ncbi:MAG TPA: cob(I)yrinic acid a,c-diamide adenosyltransferase [Chloroflexia bacterium]|nr:cob(I)yrinic acid a,c-diamide adenosyltransferase [Chloroflexia bacterium]
MRDEAAGRDAKRRLGPKLGTGDAGYTDLLGPDRVPKYDLRVQTYGDLDEASSGLGLARALAQQPRVQEIVRHVQHDLYLLMAEVAMPGGQVEKLPYRVTPEQVAWLETTITALEDEVEMPRQFILPGASAGSAALDVARAVVRRAERAAVQLASQGDLPAGQVLTYLNRCSSLLFVLARYEEAASGIPYDIAKR